MAKYRRHNTMEYRTYGSVAYAPAYDGSAVRAPRREEELQRAPKPYPQRKQQVRKRERAKVQVRPAGAVAPFAVIGFLAVAIFAVMLVTSYAQLTVANDEMVRLRSELSTLKSDNATLTAQYEKVFDLATIQAAVGETMVRPTSDQVVYIDLSAPDTVTVYQEERGSEVTTIFQVIGDFSECIIEYFR